MTGGIPESVMRQMRRLEEIDRNDRLNGTSHLERLRQIPPATGAFLKILAAAAPIGKLIEIGTSAGYSSLYIAIACRVAGVRLTTFEVLESKAALARETFRLAMVDDIVELIVGDARDHLAEYPDIAFCFLDAEKDVYGDCYSMVVPAMVPGGLFIADNVISHAEQLSGFIDMAASDDRIDSVIVPIGKGVLLCRKL